MDTKFKNPTIEELQSQTRTISNARTIDAKVSDEIRSLVIHLFGNSGTSFGREKDAGWYSTGFC